MSPRPRNRRPQLNASSLGVFGVLAAVAKSEQPLGVLELARRLKIPASTAHRALATLERCDFVDKEHETAKYHLGRAARLTTVAFFKMFPIRDASLASLRALARLTGNTASLWVRVGASMVKIAAVEGEHEIIHRRPIGQQLNLDQCAAGWAVAAANAPESGRLSKRLSDHLSALRTTGFVEDRSSEFDEFAAPVASPQGEVFAAIAIEGGTHSIFQSHRAEARKIVKILEGSLAARPEAAHNPFAHLTEG